MSTVQPETATDAYLRPLELVIRAEGYDVQIDVVSGGGQTDADNDSKGNQMTDHTAVLATLEDGIITSVTAAIQEGAPWKEIIALLAVSIGTGANTASSPEEREELLMEAAAVARRCVN